MTTDKAGRDSAAVESIPLVHEIAHVDVRDVTTGRVRVATQVETVEELVRAELQGETVEVSRITLNQSVTGPVPQIRTEGDVTIIPVFEEVLVVEKRLVLKEEVHIRRRATTEVVEMPVQLRRQTATVERVDDAGEVQSEVARATPRTL